MDIKIWENAIVVWLNSLSASSPISSINQINDSLLKAVVRKISGNSDTSTVEFLKKNFQNLMENESLKLSIGVDYLCVSTLLLIYVSLSNAEHLKEIRDLMCTKLDTSTQLSIVEFLTDLQEHEDVFSFSYNRFKNEVFPQLFLNFKEKHCVQKNNMMGDGASTPVKDMSNSSIDSPLQGFFQTPRRSVSKRGKCSYAMCGDGDFVKRIKKLTDQLVEEETEKTSLQEQLNIQTQKCIECDLKLKNKIEEMNHLKEEWDRESKRNEAEFKMLKIKLIDKLESEKQLKSELTHLEKYVSKLEIDVSNFGAKNDRLENQLKSTLDQFTASEKQLKETSELCLKLQAAICEKEKELEQIKEHYFHLYNDEKTIDVSFMNGSLDKSVCSPENLGVEMVDVLLREKMEENNSLQQMIEELKEEKQKFVNEVGVLNEQLMQKCSIISELQFLKNDLSTKVESFEKTEKELFKLQQDLVCANAEITKLNKENIHLSEKYNILNNKLQDREQVLINSNNSKMLLQINFLKLSEDLKAVQQRLELEVKNISRLTQSNYEKLSKLKGNVKSEVLEGSDFGNSIKKKSFNNSEQNLLAIKDEMTKLDLLLVDEKFSKLTELLQNFETSADWPESKTSLQKTCSLLNDNVILLKVKIREFEDQQRTLLDAQLRSEEQLKGAEEKIREMQSLNSLEIKKLTQILDERNSKIKELEDVIRNLKKIDKEPWMDKRTVKEDKITAVSERDSKTSAGDKSTRQPVAESVETKMEAPPEHPEFSDSLEEVPMVNKTFDIVNLGESNISDKTFSIKKESSESISKKGQSAWVVSPPSKVPVKKPGKEGTKSLDNRRVQGESWVVPAGPTKLKENKVKKVFSSVNDLRMKSEDVKLTELQKEIIGISKECEFYKTAFWESELKRRKDKECYDKNHEVARQNITAKYESQLEHLKHEMKQLYNRELAKHKHEQSNLSSELQDQNKRYKEHIDELRNQLWDLGEKLLQEQTQMRDMKRNYSELKEKYENLMFSKEADVRSMQVNDLSRQKESTVDERNRTSLRPIPNSTFPTMPTEDEDEVFDNRFLEDMKMGVCKTERAEDRLKELQYRNSLCLPHLKSSYPGETQFHNPTLFKESELKLGLLQFTHESQSLTDSDHSMTKSLLPDSKGKKKEQTSYKRPGPPTPSKNGGRLSIQSGDLRVTPRNVLKELNDQNERNKGTPNPLRLLLSAKGIRRASVGTRDENAAPVTPRKKNFFRKPFGARDH